MIDIHCHLLPGIDDGARTLDESLALARAAVARGIETAVMTPHVHLGRYENDFASIRRDVARFGEALVLHGIPLSIRAGAEVRIAPEIMAMVEADELPCLGISDGYRTLLLEFPPGGITVGGEKLAEWLLTRRIRPLIAHPERNKDVVRNIEKMRPFIAMGCMLQVTGGSLLGRFGDAVKRCALALLERDWVTAVASDAHDLAHRPPNLDEARDAISLIGGAALAQRMTLHGPALLLGAGVDASPH